MPDEPKNEQEPTVVHFIPRKMELEALAKTLPLQGVEIGDKRVFNIWGEDGVGKSSFISQFRESERMSKEKVLWLQPTRDEPLDDIPEFIRACAKTVRYPAKPKNEKKISGLLESVQRGKVNPIVSDDSILITRSSIAKNKRAYINQAAASSVGRTEMLRDDFEINVGLGESKANNHAEAFLDALPLKSLGTDLTIVYIEHYDRLSVTILDWIREYVLPAASKGAYRRSLVFLLESTDPLKYAYPLETWGEWSNLTEDIRLYPFSSDDAFKTAIGLRTDERHASYLQYRSLGYPGDLHEAAKQLASLNLSAAGQFLDALERPDQLKIAALSLPQSAHLDDLPVLFGSEAKLIFDWASHLPTKLITTHANGKSLSLNEALRCEAIARFHDNPKFKSYANAWKPMGRLCRNIPSRNDRAKLFLLSGLLWIDSQLCVDLFKDQSSKILPFITESAQIFARQGERYSLSERFRNDLRTAAIALNHPGVGVVFKKANALWEERQAQISESLSEVESKIESCQLLIDELSHKQREVIAHIRIHERETGSTEGIAKTSSSAFSKLLGLSKEESVDPDSPEGLRKLSQSISVQTHERERELDELNLERQKIQDALKHSYVPASLN